jgi:polysaccharide export outer membrane protein
MTLGSCGGVPLAPVEPDLEAFAETTPEAPPGLAENQPPKDVLHPGDLLDIEVVGERTWRGEAIRLGQGGAVSIPLAGSVQISGLDLNEAARELTSAARRFERQAIATAWLREPAGRTFTVNGAVAKPGVYTMLTQVRLSEALARAGGGLSSIADGELVEQGDVDAARLIRNGQVLPVSVTRALQGDVRHDAYVHSGDVLFVPSIKARRITILGEVEKPVVVAYRKGMRLTEALGRAGGLNDDADDGDVRVVRGSLAKPKIYTTSLADLISGKGRDVVLAPGDVVFVTEHWFASATDVVRRLTPVLAAAAAATILGK